MRARMEERPEDKLKDFIKEKYGNVANFCKEIGMANSTFATIMAKGINCASANNIFRICRALNISADELAMGRIVPLAETDPVMEYAIKLASLSPDAQENAFMYIDYLSSKSDDIALGKKLGLTNNTIAGKIIKEIKS